MKKRGGQSDLEELFYLQARAAGLPEPERQRHFRLPGRRNPHRFDFAWPLHGLLLDIHGGGFVGGAHGRGAGLRNDAEKLSTAVAAGWRVLVAVGDHVRSGLALQWVEAALGRGTHLAHLAPPNVARLTQMATGPSGE